MNNINTHSIDSIFSALASGRLPHCVLIEGGDSRSRKEIAVKLSKSILCKSSDNKPCDSCSHCKKIGMEIHPDVIFYTGDENSAYDAAGVREMRREVHIIPNESDYKIFVLENVEMMSVQSQNILLKTLEEPPSYAVFILLCNSSSALLETIKSRCSIYFLGSGDESAFTKDNNVKADEIAEKIAKSLVEINEFDIITAVSGLEGEKELFLPCLNALKLIFHNSLLLSQKIDFKCSETSRNLESKFSESSLIKLCEIVPVLKDYFERNMNYNLLIALLSSKLKQAIS